MELNNEIKWGFCGVVEVVGRVFGWGEVFVVLGLFILVWGIFERSIDGVSS